jgi:hypothetical protein
MTPEIKDLILDLSQLSEADLEQAQERWLHLAEDPLGDPMEGRETNPDYFVVFRMITNKELDCQLTFVFRPRNLPGFMQSNELQIACNYCTTRKNHSYVVRAWSLDSFPNNPLHVWDAFFMKDKRQYRSLMKYHDWMVKEFQNFINLFAVPERSEIHELTGYDS